MHGNTINIVKDADKRQVNFNGLVLGEFTDRAEAEIFAYHHQQGYWVRVREGDKEVHDFPKEQIRHAVNFNIDKFEKSGVQFDREWLIYHAISTYPRGLSIIKPGDNYPLIHEVDFPPLPPSK